MILKNFCDKQVFIYDLWKILSNVFYIFLVFFFVFSQKIVKIQDVEFFFLLDNIDEY